MLDFQVTQIDQIHDQKERLVEYPDAKMLHFGAGEATVLKNPRAFPTWIDWTP